MRRPVFGLGATTAWKARCAVPAAGEAVIQAASDSACHDAASVANRMLTVAPAAGTVSEEAATVR